MIYVLYNFSTVLNKQRVLSFLIPYSKIYDAKDAKIYFDKLAYSLCFRNKLMFTPKKVFQIIKKTKKKWDHIRVINKLLFTNDFLQVTILKSFENTRFSFRFQMWPLTVTSIENSTTYFRRLKHLKSQNFAKMTIVNLTKYNNDYVSILTFFCKIWKIHAF